MKKISLLLIAIFIFGISVQSQNVAITDDDSYTANSSSMLDVKSTSKGFLSPRLTTTQRNAIVTPATGLLVFDTSLNGFYYYNGTAWINLSSGSSSGLLWSYNSTNVYLTGASDKVGIGTSAPAHKLMVSDNVTLTDGTDGSFIDIQNQSNSTGVLSGIRFYNGTTANTYKGGIFYKDITGYGRGDLILANNSVNASGNVTSTDSRLTIKNTGGVEVKATTGAAANASLFHVLNATGDTIFAVYDGGVRINVYDDTLAKANTSKGGFAVGGFSPSKGTFTNDYLRITPDSIRMYIEEGNPNKATTSKGGFAVGGFSPSKAIPSDYFNVYGASSALIINPSQPRIFWYPLKEALLSGRVLVQSPDSVGFNSFATGFESRAIGNYSQSMGYACTSRGEYATSIGYQNLASGNASFALGHSCNSTAQSSTALGAFCTASNTNAMAMGFLTASSGLASIALGMAANASGTNSLSMGMWSTSSGNESIALGSSANSSGNESVAIGSNAYATGDYSVCFGTGTASGNSTFSLGSGVTAQSYMSVVTGRYNVVSGTTTSWVDTDPLFVIANGTSTSARNNAFTVLKNGNVGIGTSAPGSHRLALSSSTGGVAGSTVSVLNSASNGLAMLIENSSTSSSDNVVLITQKGSSGDLMSMDSYHGTGSWDREFRFTNLGSGLCDGSWTGGGADYAEYFIKADTTKQYEPGDVILMSSLGSTVITDNEPYSNKVVGVFSTNPVVIGNGSSEGAPANSVLVGMMGVVPTKVCNENGKIEVGDFLTTSSIPGVAMKADKPCLIIGRSMENYNETTIAKIDVLVNPTWAGNEEQIKKQDLRIKKIESENEKMKAEIELIKSIINPSAKK